ncbi:CD48 antigen-like [Mugil cephalus]|uniref:CD48 antigen-like n=1 Tax=Mugil cephalus TaxID=48193 RepID=UPI001FB79C36|nr:CD48 antigen-like [Mugil cephalus]
MRPSVTATMWAGLLRLCLLAAVSTASASELYGMVGAEVDLEPMSDGSPITKITWRDGPNIAMDWDDNGFESFRHFKDRGHLNMSTGVMTITGLVASDSGMYTPEINGKTLDSIQLTVIHPVPVPTVETMCDEEMTTCTLTCTGNTAGAEPVTYTWKEDQTTRPESSNNINILKSVPQNVEVKVFSCELKNPVSNEISVEFKNPLNNPKTLRISAGITVCVSLIAVVLVLALIHKWISGVWFYEKESMPWQLDFWKKEPRTANESNGTTARQTKDQTDEETPMY